MTLAALLAGDLVGCMDAAPDGVPRRVLLWLDPEAQFRRLLPLLEPALTERGTRLLRYDLGGGEDGDAGRGQLALLRLRLRHAMVAPSATQPTRLHALAMEPEAPDSRAGG